MLTQLIVWLNAAAAIIARVVLAPIAWLPGWLSATLIAVVTGILMLLVFKHTSNQAAISRARHQIKANLLSLSLFKDSLAVSLRSQGRILLNAGRLLALSLVPMLVMLVPMCLLLGQLALWYQARPLEVGEESIVTMHLAGTGAAGVRPQLQPSAAFELTAGPLTVPAKQFVCWRIIVRQPGLHQLSFEVGGRTITKELAVGDGFMPVSQVRPAWNWSSALLHPREAPLSPPSPVESIEVTYPDRAGWTSGADNWLIYWFAVSLVAAFAVRPLLKVSV